MSDEQRAVAVTGVGLLTALGEGREPCWRRLVAGESGVRRITRFPSDNYRVWITAAVEEGFPVAQNHTARNLWGARAVLDEALAQAGLTGAPTLRDANLFVATAQGGLHWHQRHRYLAGAAGRTPPDTFTAQAAAAAPDRDVRDGLNSEHVGASLGRALHIEAPVSVVNTACATGATAIQLAVDAIRDGECDLALVVGSDFSITDENVARFSLLSALSRQTEPDQAPRPFSESRDGFVMGEGAAALVLERVRTARERGAAPIAYVLGHGDHTENYHRTRSDPTARGAICCMQAALDDAGIPPERIDCVNAHGTGTTENDKNEDVSIHAVFGDHTPAVRVTSNKSMVGHTLTAAGVVEAAFSVLSVAEGVIPPSLNCEDRGVDLNVVTPAAAQGARTVLSNSFGFGGQNVSVVISREL